MYQSPLAVSDPQPRDSTAGPGSGLDPNDGSKCCGVRHLQFWAVMIPVLIDRYRLELLRHDLDELRVEPMRGHHADMQTASSKGGL